MKYYAKCIDHTGEEIVLIVKAKSADEASEYIKEKYKVQLLGIFDTDPTIREPRSYWPRYMGPRRGHVAL